MTSSAEVQEEANMLSVNPQRAQVLAENIAGILSRIKAANSSSRPIRLIAVSKLKPASDILALHQPPSSTQAQPQVHFGENYVQELQEKASILPSSIRWHFIGALQSNKCKTLAQSVPNLECVSSVDSEKKASELDKGRAKCLEDQKDGSGNGDGSANSASLNVHVQVNTSGEDSKSGVEPAETASLCRYILEECPHLQLRGLMTIGAIARSQAASEDGVNEDFVTLRDTRDRIMNELGELLKGKGIEEMELSMGMSADFEAAIAMGADVVRVGSEIFGERPPRKDFKVKDDAQQEKA